MNKWFRIGDEVNESLKGITPLYIDNSDVLVLNQKCIRNNKIDYNLARYHNPNRKFNDSKIVREGDLLLNSTGQGTAGRCAFVRNLPKNKTVITDSHILILRISDYYLSECFSYLLYKEEPFIQSFMDGSTGQGELDKLRLFNIEFKLPTKPEKRESICNFLHCINDKIEINNKINQELEAMAKTLYDYWFVQFDFPISEKYAKQIGDLSMKGKPYRSSGGRMVYNEQLKREIPEEWEDGLAKDIFQFNPTLSIKKGNVSSYIDMNSLPVNGFMTKQVRKKEFAGGMKFQNNDVVIARITPCLENGKTGLISLLEDEEVGFGSTEFIVIRGVDSTLKSFACCLSRSEKFRKHAISKMTGTSGRKRVKAEALENYKIPIPPKEVLQEFENMTSLYFDKMTIHTKQNQKLSELRDWLLPMLMNGQVRVAHPGEDRDLNEEYKQVEEQLGMVAEKGGKYGKG